MKLILIVHPRFKTVFTPFMLKSNSLLFVKLFQFFLRFFFFNFLILMNDTVLYMYTCTNVVTFVLVQLCKNKKKLQLLILNIFISPKVKMFSSFSKFKKMKMITMLRLCGLVERGKIKLFPKKFH